jgi:chemotaxis signal transduction protein
MKNSFNNGTVGLTVDDAYDAFRMSRRDVCAPKNTSAQSTLTGVLNAANKCSTEKIANISAMRGLQSI